MELKKGETIMIDAALHLPAVFLHEAFSDRSGVPLDFFELYYRGKRLEGEAALASWGVGKGSTIEVKMRGRGGMTPMQPDSGAQPAQPDSGAGVQPVASSAPAAPLPAAAGSGVKVTQLQATGTLVDTPPLASRVPQRPATGGSNSATRLSAPHRSHSRVLPWIPLSGVLPQA